MNEKISDEIKYKLLNKICVIYDRINLTTDYTNYDYYCLIGDLKSICNIKIYIKKIVKKISKVISMDSTKNVRKRATSTKSYIESEDTNDDTANESVFECDEISTNKKAKTTAGTSKRGRKSNIENERLQIEILEKQLLEQDNEAVKKYIAEQINEKKQHVHMYENNKNIISKNKNESSDINLDEKINNINKSYSSLDKNNRKQIKASQINKRRVPSEPDTISKEQISFDETIAQAVLNKKNMNNSNKSWSTRNKGVFSSSNSSINTSVVSNVLSSTINTSNVSTKLTENSLPSKLAESFNNLLPYLDNLTLKYESDIFKKYMKEINCERNDLDDKMDQLLGEISVRNYNVYKRQKKQAMCLEDTEYILKIECHDLDNYYEVKSLELEKNMFKSHKVNLLPTNNKLLIFCHIPININETNTNVKKSLMDNYGICNVERYRDDKGKPTSKCVVHMIDVDTWLWIYKHGFHCCGKFIVTSEKIYKPKCCKKCKQIGHNVERCTNADEVCETCSVVIPANQSELLNSNNKKKHICQKDVIKCVNCGLKHSSYSIECYKYKLEYNRINRAYMQIISISGASKSKYNKKATDLLNEKSTINQTTDMSTINLVNDAVNKAMNEYKSEQQLVNEKVNEDLKRIEARVDVTNKNFKAFKKQARTAENTVTNYLHTLLQFQVKDESKLEEITSNLKKKNTEFTNNYKSSDEDDAER